MSKHHKKRIKEIIKIRKKILEIMCGKFKLL